MSIRDKRFKPHFGRAGQRQSTPIPKLHYDNQAYPNSLEIGSIVLAKAASFIPSYTGDEMRPMVVYGVWRDKERIKSVEVMPLQGNLSETYTSDYAIDTPELIKRFGVVKECKLATNKTFIVENTRRFFPVPKYAPPIIDHMLWPEILARRVNALLYDPYRHFGSNADLSGLTREGFTFEEIDPKHNLRNNVVPALDIHDDHYGRKPSRILDQEKVNLVASFAVSYYKHARSTGAKVHDGYLIYPPLCGWMQLERQDFPRWPENRGQIPAMGIVPAAAPV